MIKNEWLIINMSFWALAKNLIYIFRFAQDDSGSQLEISAIFF